MSHDESVEFEAVQDGCAQFVGSLEAAKAFAESEGPWAFSIYEVRRKLVWKSGASGSLAAPVPDAHPNTDAQEGVQKAPGELELTSLRGRLSRARELLDDVLINGGVGNPLEEEIWNFLESS